MGSTHNRKKQTPKCQDTEVGTTSHLGTTRSLRGKRRRESGDIGRMKHARRLNGLVRSAAKGNVMRKGGASSSERMTARGHWDLTMHNTGGARMTARGRWDLTMHNTRSGSQRQWTQCVVRWRE